MKAFEPFLGPAWEAEGGADLGRVAGGASRVRSTFAWVPLADGIYLRTVAMGEDAEPGHLLDAYLYHHTGTGRLRCLALTERGGVYEGDVSVLDGGALQIDLEGYEGDRVVPCEVRFNFEPDGAVRQRVWSGEIDAKGSSPSAVAAGIGHGAPPPSSSTEIAS